jgi:hypothetical protein
MRHFTKKIKKSQEYRLNNPSEKYGRHINFFRKDISPRFKKFKNEKIQINLYFSLSPHNMESHIALPSFSKNIETPPAPPIPPSPPPEEFETLMDLSSRLSSITYDVNQLLTNMRQSTIHQYIEQLNNTLFGDLPLKTDQSRQWLDIHFNKWETPGPRAYIVSSEGERLIDLTTTTNPYLGKPFTLKQKHPNKNTFVYYTIPSLRAEEIINDITFYRRLILGGSALIKIPINDLDQINSFARLFKKTILLDSLCIFGYEYQGPTATIKSLPTPETLKFLIKGLEFSINLHQLFYYQSPENWQRVAASITSRLKEINDAIPFNSADLNTLPITPIFTNPTLTILHFLNKYSWDPSINLSPYNNKIAARLIMTLISTKTKLIGQFDTGDGFLTAHLLLAAPHKIQINATRVTAQTKTLIKKSELKHHHLKEVHTLLDTEQQYDLILLDQPISEKPQVILADRLTKLRGAIIINQSDLDAATYLKNYGYAPHKFTPGIIIFTKQIERLNYSPQKY